MESARTMAPSPRPLTGTVTVWLPSQSGRTPLHFAASHGHADAVLLLIQLGACATLCDKVCESGCCWNPRHDGVSWW
jgi:hypothetical protein